MRRLAFSLAAICALAVPAPLLACSCMGPRTEREAVAQSTAVFEGRVVWVRTVEDGVHGEAREATILVSGWTKGEGGRMARVRTSTSSCGVSFRVGRTVRVYAARDPRQAGSPLFTGACSAPPPVPDEPVAARVSARLNAPSRTARR